MSPALLRPRSVDSDPVYVSRGPILLGQPLEKAGISEGVRQLGLRDLAERAGAPPAPGPDWTSVLLPDLEAQLLVALNAERAKAGGLHPLALGAHVQASIAFYCLEMAQFEFMAHDSPDTGDPRWPAMPWSTRIYLFGVPTTAAIGENLAYGFLDVPSVVAAWMSDYGHRQNILNTSWTTFGCGVARDAKSGLLFWGTDFSSETGSPPPPPDPGPGPGPNPPPADHTHPVAGDTWVSRKNAKATVHVDATAVKKGVTRVTYTPAKGVQTTTTETRFTTVYKWKASA